MSRINVCPACNAERNGVKSRIAFPHTCAEKMEMKPYQVGDVVYFNMAILPGPVMSRRAVVVKVITDFYYEVEYERQGEKVTKRLIWSHLSPTP